MSLLLLAACTSTKVCNEWRNPDLPAAHFSHLVVTALFKQDQTRRLFENEFAQQLSNLGLMVTRSYILVPRLDENTAGQLPRLARSMFADGFMAIRMTKSKPNTSADVSNPPPDRIMLSDFLQSSWADNIEPPSATSNNVMFIESRLYDVSTGKLVWSLCTESKNQFGLQWEINLLGKMVLGKMRKMK